MRVRHTVQMYHLHQVALCFFPILYPVLSLIYHVPAPKRTRNKPLEVIALGLSRSGTESLRSALEELGYTPCYHGWLPTTDRSSEARQWTKLLCRKFRETKKIHNHITPEMTTSIRAKDFDEIIGDCCAVTDVPCCVFGPELIRCYPEAKVILNRRKDVDAWKKSMQDGPFAVTKSIFLYLITFFDAEAFWIAWMHNLEYCDYFGWEFDQSAIQGYEEHFERLANMVEPGSYLEWTVEDGWYVLPVHNHASLP